MAKAIGLLLGVAAIWATVEIYVNGTAGAFGGRLAPWMEAAGSDPGPSRASAPRRAGETVERAHHEQQQRYDRLLED